MKSIIKKSMRMIAIVLTVCMCTVSLSFAEDVPENSVTETEETEGVLTDLKEKGYEIQFVNEEKYVYTGDEITPEIQVVYTDEEGKKDVLPAKNEDETENYTVEYKNNVNAGEAQVVVAGNEETGYTGTIEASFAITGKSIENMEATLNASKYYYTGKAVVPSVTLKDGDKELILNEDYKVSATAKEIGTAYATVSGCGNYSGSINVKYTISLGTPASFKTSPTAYNKITLSWKKVTGASGYVIYRSTSQNGKYVSKTITSGSTLSWADTGRTVGTTYYYKLRAYRMVNGNMKYGAYTPIIKQKAQVGTPSITKVSASSYNSLKITWTKKSDASGYAIYRSTSEKGTYTRIGTAKKASTVSFTDKSRSCGYTYYYKVRAYRTSNRTNYYGSYSAVKSGHTVPSKSTISASSISDDTKVTLKWSKSNGASGYQIYRRTSSGSYELVKTITSGNTLSWTNTGLTKGTIYYYRIRGYRTVNGKKIYGSYSAEFKKNKSNWRYVNGYKLYYDSNGKLVKNVDKIIGKQSSYIIKVNKQKNVVTVYAKDPATGKYIVPVKSFVCSTGYATPVGTFKTPAKYRWHTLMGPCWGQWCTRIHGGVLFHSVFYRSPNNNNTLAVSAYNKLGTTCSHGCVRLTAGDAKWIYDNCKLNTTVTVYSSSNAGPFGKPSAYKLPSWHSWDPTDPNMHYKCTKKGCH